jgi:hypothetical protein
MEERLQKYLKIVGITIIAFVVILEIISLIIGANIKKIVVSQINNLVTVPVNVNGNIDFSLLAHFPYATLSFKDVDIEGSLNGDSLHLIKAHDVYLLFSIYNLFEKNYTVQRIVVKKAELNFIYDKTGKSNFNIFKSDTVDKTVTTFYIKELSLNDVATTYNDMQNNIYISFKIKEGALAGTITGNQFLFTDNINAYCNYITVNKETYLKNKIIKLKSNLNYNSSSEKLIINQALATVEGNGFNITGNVQSYSNYTSVNLAFHGKDLNLISVASLLPLNESKYIYAYHSKGDFTMSGKITGNSSSTSNPAVNINFVVKDGEVKNDNIEKKFKNISFSGELVTDSSLNFHKSNLTIRGLYATIDGQPITGSFTLQNFHLPYVDIQLNATINLKNIYPLFHLNQVKDMYGNVEFENVYYKGPLTHLSQKSEISKINAGGNIIIKNVTIVFDRNHLNHINGNFKIVNSETAVNNLQIVSNGTDILFNGTVKNAVSAIFNALNKKTKNERVELNISCNAKNINWTDLEVNSSSQQNDSIHFLPSFLNTFEGTISAKIGHFKYEKFDANNLTGTVEIHPDKIFLTTISFDAINGNVQANGTLNTADLNNITLETTSQLTNIDINKLFYVFDNFDQNEITDKNLRGQLTIKQLFVHAVWTNYKFNDSKLHVISDIDIKNGELVNYSPMNALASFIKLSELKDVHFSELQNNIEIKDRIVNIPYMTIHSNALNVDISGTQTFDNIVNYNIKLNLLQLLGNKFHKTNYTADNSEKDVTGALNLYLVMTGPVSNPDIKYDKAAVKKKIKKGIKEQQKEVKAALNNEFSKQKQEQNKAKDWAPEQQQFIDFSDTTTTKGSTTPSTQTTQPQQTDTTSTRYKQKKAFRDFKNKLFHKNQPPPN